MPKIQIKTSGRFRQWVNQPQFEMHLSDGDTVQSLIDRLGLPDDPDLWVLVNHVPVQRDHPLQPGDQLTFFQPIAGG